MIQEYPTVSIILPIYNAGQFLRPQIDSILSQTYPISELLLIDDGSIDDSPNIAQDYANRYTFVKLLRNEVNKGLQTTINDAISQVSGDLVAFSDHDDIWMSDKVECQVSYFLTYPNVTCAFSDRTVVDIENRELCASEYKRTITPPELADTHFLLSSRSPQTHANTLMFRSDLIDAIFPIPRGWDWWIGVIASWYGQIAFIPEPLVRYRVYEGSISSHHTKYLKEHHPYVTRTTIRENIKRRYETLLFLCERAQVLEICNSSLSLIERWTEWYKVLLDLLTHPTWQSHKSLISMMFSMGRIQQWPKVTLYALPFFHEVYLKFCTLKL